MPSVGLKVRHWAVWPLMLTSICPAVQFMSSLKRQVVASQRLTRLWLSSFM